MTPAGFMVREELRLLWREGHAAWALAAFVALVVIAA